MGLRNTLIGAGLVGILGAQEVQAADAKDTGYATMSLGELTERVQEKTVVLNDFNFKKEVTDYDGAALVLFYSSCPQTENADTINKNMDIVYLQLVDTFDDTKVNGLPLKFTSFDGCKYRGNNSKTILGLNVRDTETHMYLDGREIDRRRGGPIGVDGINPAIKNMTYWINYDLLRITEPGEENIVLLYQGGMEWNEFPRSILNK
ncbi:MAG: hypothetical protein Q8R18_00995 [bacterium]|nr:hypothetical protein [bacterium]